MGPGSQPGDPALGTLVAVSRADGERGAIHRHDLVGPGGSVAPLADQRRCELRPPQSRCSSSRGGPACSSGEYASPHRMRCAITGNRARPFSVAWYSNRLGMLLVAAAFQHAVLDQFAQPVGQHGVRDAQAVDQVVEPVQAANTSRRISSVQRSPMISRTASALTCCCAGSRCSLVRVVERRATTPPARPPAGRAPATRCSGCTWPLTGPAWHIPPDHRAADEARRLHTALGLPLPPRILHLRHRGRRNPLTSYNTTSW